MTYTCFAVGALQANCYLLWDENGNALLIDAGDNAPLLLNELRTRKLTLRGILLTHAHFDHMMAVPALVAATDAPLFVPEADAAALQDSSRSLTYLLDGVTPTFPAPARLLRDGDTVTAGDLSLTVFHTAGHTSGSSCYYGHGMLFSGDTLFADGGVGRTDFPTGDAAALRRSVHRLLTLADDTVVLSGHGEPSTIGAERRWHTFG